MVVQPYDCSMVSFINHLPLPHIDQEHMQLNMHTLKHQFKHPFDILKDIQMPSLICLFTPYPEPETKS